MNTTEVALGIALGATVGTVSLVVREWIQRRRDRDFHRRLRDPSKWDRR